MLKTTSVEIDLSLVGGKGSSLIKLKNARVSVPSFFVVTTDAFNYFVEKGCIKDKLKELYQQNKLKEISKLIMSTAMPEDLEKEILSEFKKLKTQKVSVRSSAVVEDSNTKSCAGQFQTFLFVEKKNLILSIKKCMASLFSTNVKAYINDTEQIFKGIAVIVQVMVDSKYAGVAFSTDYNDRNSNYCVLEVVKGQGEKLVSGAVSPSKYIVRKGQLSIDNVVGKDFKIDKQIVEIAKTCGKIEKLYGMPMDTEWAIDKNQKVYFLQARPIVAFNKPHQIFMKIISRPRSLALTELLAMEEFEGLKGLFAGMYFMKPLFYYDGKTFHEYGNISSMEEYPVAIIKQLIRKNIVTEKHIEKVLRSAQNVEAVVEGKKKFDIEKFVKDFTIFGSFNLLANFVDGTNIICDKSVVPAKIFKLLCKNKDYYDDILYKVDPFFEQQVEIFVNDKLKKYARLMTIDEIFRGKKVTEVTLQKRQQGLMLFDHKVTPISSQDEFLKVAQRNNIYIKERQHIDENMISGQVAYMDGVVRGTVKIIFNEDDLSKVCKGDIIVSPMTVPTFMKAMKSCCGIITDEGGTVCHAAIIARELKKPCLIGTKSATSVFKDGDLVELNTITMTASKIKK